LREISGQIAEKWLQNAEYSEKVIRSKPALEGWPWMTNFIGKLNLLKKFKFVVKKPLSKSCK
jgi:hypothetical protein